MVKKTVRSCFGTYGNRSCDSFFCGDSLECMKVYFDWFKKSRRKKLRLTKTIMDYCYVNNFERQPFKRKFKKNGGSKMEFRKIDADTRFDPVEQV